MKTKHSNLKKIPPELVPRFIGALVHYGDYSTGAVYRVKRVEGDHAVVHTPKTYRYRRLPVNNLYAARGYADRLLDTHA